MTRLPDARQLLAEAERAASAGDLGSADGLLRQAARIQESELGPLHPDLASTLNNLAIVAERTGRPGDAETFYRRAAAIAAASLPANHPMVAASRQNLEDFCRASGLPIETPPAATPPTGAADWSRLSPGRDAAGAATLSPGGAAPARTAQASTPTAGRAAPVARPKEADTPSPERDPGRGASRVPAWLGVGVAVALAAALVATRPWSSSDAGGASVTLESDGAAAPAAPTTEPPAAQPGGLEEPAAAVPAEPPAAPPPSPAARAEQVEPRADRAPLSPGRSANGVTLTVAELCRTFSTRGRVWQCDPAGASVAPGRLVFYTRVRSPSDTSVVHRWYRGETLRQAVTLRIRANPTEGYRTYSSQTVDGGEDWRVEVTTAAGDLLHEHGVAVR